VILCSVISMSPFAQAVDYAGCDDLERILLNSALHSHSGAAGFFRLMYGFHKE
jgi:hypothetical protein